jgi:hypothetical protein
MFLVSIVKASTLLVQGPQHFCGMPLDTSNTEVAMAPSQPQPQPPLLEVPIPTTPTTHRCRLLRIVTSPVECRDCH